MSEQILTSEAMQQTAETEDSFSEEWDSDKPEESSTQSEEPSGEQQPAAAAPAPEAVAPQPEAAHTQSDDERRENAERSMQGRLEAERRRREELENELRALKARMSQPQQAAQHAQPGIGRTDGPEISALVGQPIPAADVDEDTRNLIIGFGKEHRELGRLLIEDSDSGKELRKILVEYGAEHTATMARTEMTRREVAYREEQRSQAVERSTLANHYQTLANDHPEFADALLGVGDDAAEKAKHLGRDFRTWIDNQPYHRAVVIEEAMRTNDTRTLSEALGAFKADLRAVIKMHEERQRSSQNANATRRAADAGAAVLTRGAPAVPKSQPDKNDFDSAWDES